MICARQRVLAACVGVVVMVLVVATPVACSRGQRAAGRRVSSTPTSTTPSMPRPLTAPTSTTVPVWADPFLTELLRYPMAQYNAMEATSAGPVGFVLYATRTGGPAVVDVWYWREQAWVLVATVGGNLPTRESLDPLLAKPSSPTLTLAHLTGAAEPDALVIQRGGAAGFGIYGSVVSDIGGTWHLVKFAGALGVTKAGVEVAEPEVSGDEIIQRLNTCMPTCGDGMVQLVAYRYDAAVSEFIPIGR
jgi:hypothetical protein